MATLVAGATRFTKVQLTGSVLYDADGAQILGSQAGTVAAVSGTIPAGSTGTFGFKTATDRNTAITTILEIKTCVNAILSALKTHGLIDT